VIFFSFLIFIIHFNCHAKYLVENKNYDYLGKEKIYQEVDNYFYKYKLKNGLKIVVYESEKEEINFHILVNAGNNREINGIYETYLNPKYSEKIFLKNKYLIKLENYYSKNEESFFSSNFLKFSYNFKPKNLDFIIENSYLSFKNPDLSNKIIDKSKDEVFNLLELDYDNSIYKDLFKCLKNNSIHDGDYKSEIKNIDFKKIKNYYYDFFTPNNIVLIVEGNVNHKFIVDKISKFYHLLPEKNTIPFKNLENNINNSNKNLTCIFNADPEQKFEANLIFFFNHNFTEKDILYRKILSKSVEDLFKTILTTNINYPFNNFFIDTFMFQSKIGDKDKFNEYLKYSTFNVTLSDKKIDEDFCPCEGISDVEYLYYNIMLEENNIFDKDSIHKIINKFDSNDFEKWVKEKYIDNKNKLHIKFKPIFKNDVDK
jgi:hypothetical protein